jgi:hypothetical protein
MDHDIIQKRIAGHISVMYTLSEEESKLHMNIQKLTGMDHDIIQKRTAGSKLHTKILVTQEGTKNNITETENIKKKSYV